MLLSLYILLLSSQLERFHYDFTYLTPESWKSKYKPEARMFPVKANTFLVIRKPMSAEFEPVNHDGLK